MSSSDENEFEAQTYVSVETHGVPSPPPLPPLIEEERDRSGSSASSSSSSSSSSAASSCAPASSHSEDTRQEVVEVRVVQEVVTRNEWQREEERVEVVSMETTWETRSAEDHVEQTDGGRMSRRSSSSSSSSASSGKGRVMEKRESTGGPQITLFVKVGNRFENRRANSTYSGSCGSLSGLIAAKGGKGQPMPTSASSCLKMCACVCVWTLASMSVNTPLLLRGSKLKFGGQRDGNAEAFPVAWPCERWRVAVSCSVLLQTPEFIKSDATNPVYHQK